MSDEKTKHSARVMKKPEPIIPATASPYITGPEHCNITHFQYHNHKVTQLQHKQQLPSPSSGPTVDNCSQNNNLKVKRLNNSSKIYLPKCLYGL